MKNAHAGRLPSDVLRRYEELLEAREGEVIVAATVLVATLKGCGDVLEAEDSLIEAVESLQTLKGKRPA